MTLDLILDAVTAARIRADRARVALVGAALAWEPSSTYGSDPQAHLFTILALRAAVRDFRRETERWLRLDAIARRRQRVRAALEVH